MANCLYIVKEGSVNCQIDGKIIRKLGVGEFFGEMSILFDSVRSLDVVANENCTLYDISLETLQTLLGVKYKDALMLNFVKTCFEQSNYFKKLSPESIENSFSSFKVLKIAKSQVVISAGTITSENLIIVLQGNLVDVSCF